MNNLGWKGLTCSSLSLGWKLLPMFRSTYDEAPPIYKVLTMKLATTQYVQLLGNCFDIQNFASLCSNSKNILYF